MVGSKLKRKRLAPFFNTLVQTSAAVSFIFFSTGSFCKADQPADYTVKAAYIYSFLKFIDWPEQPLVKNNPTLTICSLGTSPLNFAVKALDGRTVQKHVLTVKDVRLTDDMSNCHVLVSSGIRTDQLTLLFKKLEQNPILTVGESSNFARDLGVIGFTIVDDRVKLEINLMRAQLKNIKLSAQLLEVAERIYRDEISRDGGQP